MTGGRRAEGGTCGGDGGNGIKLSCKSGTMEEKSGEGMSAVPVIMELSKSV